jgi:hypothetical protein
MAIGFFLLMTAAITTAFVVGSTPAPRIVSQGDVTP